MILYTCKKDNAKETEEMEMRGAFNTIILHMGEEEMAD